MAKRATHEDEDRYYNPSPNRWSSGNRWPDETTRPPREAPADDTKAVLRAMDLYVAAATDFGQFLDMMGEKATTKAARKALRNYLFNKVKQPSSKELAGRVLDSLDRHEAGEDVSGKRVKSAFDLLMEDDD